MTDAARLNLARSARLLVAVVGGYAFASGLMAMIGAGLVNLGVARSEAATLAGLLGSLIFVGGIVWMVASTSPVRTGVLMAGIAAASFLAAPAMVAG